MVPTAGSDTPLLHMHKLKGAGRRNSLGVHSASESSLWQTAAHLPRRGRAVQVHPIGTHVESAWN